MPDVAIAAAFVVVGQVDVWFPDLAFWGDDPVVGHAILNAVVFLLVGAAVAWRRVAPLAAVAVAAAAVACQAVLTREPPIGLLVAGPILVLSYSVASYASRRHAWLGLMLIAAATAVHDALDPALRTAQDYGEASYWWLVIAVAWLIGRTVGAQRRARAQASAARLEAAERAKAEQEAVMAERLRIAHELHDIVAHSVSVVALQAGAALEVLERSPERARQPLLAIEGTARSTLVELGALVSILRSPGDEEQVVQPGLALLPELAERVRAAGLPVRLEIRGEPIALPPGLDLSAYRIVQEALTNALKHAGVAARAAVTVSYRPGELALSVTDDGTGSSGATMPHQGHGLVGMRERAALYGGQLKIGGGPGGGYCVNARLPLAQAPSSSGLA